MNNSPIYALDFDGVLCNSAVETAITGWKAAQTLWSDMNNQSITPELIQQFIHIRPLLETGYEAILIMRYLSIQGEDDSILSDYHSTLDALVNSNKLNIDDLKVLFGSTRDQWIKSDEKDWLDNNPLFPGIADRLKTLTAQQWIIVTTKQERFVKLILQANGISIDDDAIYGLDRKLSKQQVLHDRLSKQPPQKTDQPAIIFIEDRLPTLLGVQNNPSLDRVELKLASWGYNTPADRECAEAQSIEVIDLHQF